MPSEPASPCVNICRMEDGVCEGCGRTLEEITRWPTATPVVKRLILAASRARLRSAGPSRHA